MAETDLPRNGIQELCEVRYPIGYRGPSTEYSTGGYSETQIMTYYLGQIQIQNQLNDIQKALFAPESMYDLTSWISRIC